MGSRPESHQLETNCNVHASYDIIIGDISFYQNLLNANYSIISAPHRLLIIQKNEIVQTDFYNKLRPTVILSADETHLIPMKMAEANVESNKAEQSLLARESIEAKREELEKLNEFLSYQDKERTNALKIFHAEEQSKKHHEKQLLFFLDFINSNYANSNFLDELLKYIWIEIKKIGSFYQMGVLVKFEGEDQAVLFQYDDRKYYSQKSVLFDESKTYDINSFTSFLANLYQRPVGKILFWQETNTKVQFHFYLETQGKEYKTKDIELFISDRMSLLSLIISRWVTEKSEKTLLRQWRNTFKAYKDPIHVVDEDFNIIQANYLSKPDETRKCFEVLAGRKQQCEHCPLAQPAQTKTFVTFDNQDFQVHLTPFSVPSNAYNSVMKKYYLLFYENITEINSLKSQVIQSEKMSTIGNLANHLAHELNNPLTGLKLNSEYLISEIQSQPATTSQTNLANDLNEVLKATLRSEMIIKDLVDFSSETAKEMQEIDFSIVLKKTMTLLKSVLRNNRVFIDVKSYMIHAQPVYLQQVIFNLIKNACEAMGSQGNVKIYQGAPHSQHSDFMIEDNGPGIEEKFVDDIFKPFFTTKKEGEGTGLGLYLCATLMQKMNGELIYDKNFKSGARFILRFKK